MAKIANAHAEILKGNEDGYKTIIEALDGLVEFIQELTDDLDVCNLEDKEEQQ